MIAVFQRQIQIGPGGGITFAPEKGFILLLCQAVNDPHICRTAEGEPKYHILIIVLVVDLVGGCLAALVKLLRTSAVLIQGKLPFMPGRLNGIDELFRIVLAADGDISHVSGAVIFQTHIVDIIGASASALSVFRYGIGKTASAVGKNRAGIQILHVVIHHAAVRCQHLLIFRKNGFQIFLLISDDPLRLLPDLFIAAVVRFDDVSGITDLHLHRF